MGPELVLLCKRLYSVYKAAYSVKSDNYFHFMLALRIFYDKKQG
jgi:hypothetical protein